MRRHELLASQTMSYGGIPVYRDNAVYAGNNGTASGYTDDPGWFLAGPFDTGTTGTKSMTYSRFPDTFGSGTVPGLRMFNDLTATSVDWWPNGGNASTQNTVNTAGRYIIVSMPKAKAANQYLYITSGGVTTYLYKGNNV